MCPPSKSRDQSGLNLTAGRMTELNPKKRFSNRVDDYRKFRPHYPGAIVETVKEICGLNGRSVVADIGSGTGIMTELLAPYCSKIYAVEPNKEMRAAADEALQSNPHFSSIDGAAEATGLEDGTIDIIVSAQAFHWFDRRLTGKEFRRILKPGGWVVLVWNTRRSTGDQFHIELEAYLRSSTPEYLKVHHKHIRGTTLREFFSNDAIIRRNFSNQQELDWKGFKGRMLSASYVPKPRTPHYRDTMRGFEEIFRRHQVDGKIVIEYVTEVYISRFL